MQSLQSFPGLVNYAKPFIKNLSKLVGPLYSKLRNSMFNLEDSKLIDKIKQVIEKLPSLKLPSDSDYLIMETKCCELGYGAILKNKPHNILLN